MPFLSFLEAAKIREEHRKAKGSFTLQNCPSARVLKYIRGSAFYEIRTIRIHIIPAADFTHHFG
jgi:hypothetical protein